MSNTHLFSPATLAAQCDLVEQRLLTDPVNGSSWVLTYEGSEWGVQLMAATVLAYGAKTETTSTGGKCRMVATFAKDPSTASNPAAEVPIERWDLDEELVQISIWAIPEVIRELNSYVSLFGSGLTPSKLKKQITDAVQNGEDYPLIDRAGYPAVYRVYSKLVNNVEYYETKRPVLSKIRTYTDAYTSRTQVVQRETVYKTESLVSTFAVPVAIQNTLPIDPPDTETPVNTDGTIAGVWSWKLRGVRLSYNRATARWEESLTWAFSAWDKDLYLVV